MKIVVDSNRRLQDQNPRIGDGVEIELESGESLVATVASVSDSKLTLNPNHPLAGKHVTFAIRLLDIVQRHHSGAYLNRIPETAQDSGAGKWRESCYLPA
jgi:FKBP-type peptidyl-prolyl cis-trans isomerase 2